MHTRSRKTQSAQSYDQEVPAVRVDLDEATHRQAKAAAALAGEPLRDWVARLIREAVAAEAKKKK